jgi:hypothetical protein
MKNIAKNDIGYSGKVKISALRDGVVLDTHEFKNAGTGTLFSFFAYCLMGEFDEASLYCPTKIRLLRINKGDSGYDDDFSADPASGLVYLRTKPERIITSGVDGETVKLSFMIPRTMIDRVDFNRIALYPHFAGDEEYYSYSAYCDLSGEDDLGAEIYTAWTLSSVLLIDWELTIANKISKVIPNEEELKQLAKKYLDENNTGGTN